ncbi:MAG: UDP-N-acetylglucosamine--N-acetylmuramyl-(pentapeptide) pyrophosphoryl-undecaprenol N-acetylglucosamine transferase [Gammaproteobacteria bacterium]
MSLAASNLRVLVMAGGTGGHVFPALAVAECLRDRGAEVRWLGALGGMESTLVPQHGFEFHGIAIRGLRGNGLRGWLSAPWRVLRATCTAMAVLRKMRANVVLGMGGFASGPGGLAAWLTRRPLVIHEQNAVAGLTNRILSRLANRVLEAFPGSFAASFAAHPSGNPVRTAIAALPAPAQRFAARDHDDIDRNEAGNDSDRAAGQTKDDRPVLRLLVLGGSQGARVFNEVVPQALAMLADRVRVEVCHQTGKSHLQSTSRAYQELALEVTRVGGPVAFIDDMAQRYGWADLVLCRAGAMTIAELASAGVASILVPFPHAVDDHQTANARYLSDAQAAVLLPQSQLVPSRLATILEEFAHRRERLLAMAEAARGRAMIDASERVAQHCMEVAHV